MADSADSDRKMVFFREDPEVDTEGTTEGTPLPGLIVAEEGGGLPDNVREGALSGTPDNVMLPLSENPTESDPSNGGVNDHVEDTHENDSPNGSINGPVVGNSSEDDSPNGDLDAPVEDIPKNVRDGAWADKSAPLRKPLNGRPRSRSEIVRDRALIADLYLRRFTQQQIADRLGLGQSTVSEELKVLHTEWQERAGIDVNEARQRELATIDKVELEAWKGWLKSCGSVTERVYKTTTGPEGVRVEETEKVKELAGDKGFLDVIDKCVRQRCKILGVEAPKENLLEIGPTLAQVIGTLPEGTRAMVVGTLQAAIERDGDE